MGEREKKEERGNGNKHYRRFSTRGREKKIIRRNVATGSSLGFKSGSNEEGRCGAKVYTQRKMVWNRRYEVTGAGGAAG